ncbi:hypothetical protein BOTBODRAFT_270426 [Botryobasidium botryosum FD-172 SS1]|uniref:Uncharacterized protein n=1 Tax=Botryobasidium botryosum (strain FD-172 SS1) TaxID=930990 RepID=A0A067LS81_BOTB1|nr:hypothetical protein BOTBODRAFT_270426 [Botryobasidium botryosum FD-172 SS1]
MRRAHTPALSRHLNSIVATTALHLAIHLFQSPRGSSSLIFLFHLSHAAPGRSPTNWTGNGDSTTCHALTVVRDLSRFITCYRLRRFRPSHSLFAIALGAPLPHLSPLCFFSPRRPPTNRTRACGRVGYAQIPTLGRQAVTGPPSPPRLST